MPLGADIANAENIIFELAFDGDGIIFSVRGLDPWIERGSERIGFVTQEIYIGIGVFRRGIQGRKGQWIRLAVAFTAGGRDVGSCEKRRSRAGE
jgi:hypothetical protein